MASIIRRSPMAAGLRRFGEWDPVQAMRDMMERWEREVTPFFGARRVTEFVPDFELKETKDGYVVRGDVPGTPLENIDVSLDGNTMTIRGHREEEKLEEGEQYFVCERDYGAFLRQFTLPEAADTEHAKAQLKDGVLTLAIPRKEGAAARKIQIGAGEQPKA